MTNYYNEFIDFFKRHNLYDKVIFDYINSNSIKFDYRDDEKRPFIGCYYICNKQNILQNIKLYVPFIDSPITTLINIHEYIHAIESYNKIGKIYQKENTEETLPILYELLYFEENPSKELEHHLIYLNSKINNDSKESYKIALSIKNELLKYYKEENPNLTKLQRKAKQLSRKHHKNNP